MALDQLKEYWRPTEMSEALALLRRPSPRTVPLAGGAHLAVHRDPRVEAVVDLGALGLDTIEATHVECRIGAMVCLDDLAAGGVPGAGGRLLAEVAQRQKSWQLRRAGTLGGTLVTGALPELDAALWALDAQVELEDARARMVSFGAFLDERGCLAAGTLVTAVVVPGLTAGEGAGAARTSRTPADAPAVAAAAYMKRAGDRVTGARLIVTGLAPRPVRMGTVEEALTGQVWSDGLVDGALAAGRAIPVLDDMRGSAAYRAAMVDVCARRALVAAWGRSAAETVAEGT